MHPGHKGLVLSRLEVPLKKVGLLTHLSVKDKKLSDWEITFSPTLSKECKARNQQAQTLIGPIPHLCNEKDTTNMQICLQQILNTDAQPESLHSPRQEHYGVKL